MKNNAQLMKRLGVRTFEEGQGDKSADLVNQGVSDVEIQDFITKNEFKMDPMTITYAFNLNEQEIQAEQSRIRNQVADMLNIQSDLRGIDDENISKAYLLQRL